MNFSRNKSSYLSLPDDSPLSSRLYGSAPGRVTQGELHQLPWCVGQIRDSAWCDVATGEVLTVEREIPRLLFRDQDACEIGNWVRVDLMTAEGQLAWVVYRLNFIERQLQAVRSQFPAPDKDAAARLRAQLQLLETMQAKAKTQAGLISRANRFAVYLDGEYQFKPIPALQVDDLVQIVYPVCDRNLGVVKAIEGDYARVMLEEQRLVKSYEIGQLEKIADDPARQQLRHLQTQLIELEVQIKEAEEKPQMSGWIETEYKTSGLKTYGPYFKHCFQAAGTQSKRGTKKVSVSRKDIGRYREEIANRHRVEELKARRKSLVTEIDRLEAITRGHIVARTAIAPNQQLGHWDVYDSRTGHGRTHQSKSFTVSVVQWVTGKCGGLKRGKAIWTKRVLANASAEHIEAVLIEASAIASQKNH